MLAAIVEIVPLDEFALATGVARKASSTIMVGSSFIAITSTASR